MDLEKGKAGHPARQSISSQGGAHDPTAAFGPAAGLMVDAKSPH